MGLEKHVNIVIKESNPDLIDSFWWSNGMNVEEGNPQTASDLMEILESSGEFGPTKFNPKTGKIEFGVHRQFFKTDEEFLSYCKSFKK